MFWYPWLTFPIMRLLDDRALEAGLQPAASAQFPEGCAAGGISPEMEETRTPKTGWDWRIFLTPDLDQILGAGHMWDFFGFRVMTKNMDSEKPADA